MIKKRLNSGELNLETYKKGSTRMSNAFYTYTMLRSKSTDLIGVNLPARSLPELI